MRMVWIVTVFFLCTTIQVQASFLAHADTLVKELQDTYRVPGVALAIVEDGKVVYAEGFGLMNRRHPRPVEAHTVFQVASISKPVAALGIMRLVEEGVIDLDVSVNSYLTRWKIPPSRFGEDKVTIRSLLNHTSGLSPRSYFGFHPNRQTPALERSLTGRARLGKRVRLTGEPGATSAYSGGGYSVLQLLIEEVSGLPFADYMVQNVFAPLGMARSSFTWDEDLRSSTATGYSVYGTAYPTYLYTEEAAAGLFTTAEDLARMMAVIMSDYAGGNDFLSQEALEQMFVSTFGYGLGFAVRERSGELVVSHGGANPGWKAYMMMLPNRASGVIVLTNSDRGQELYPAIVNAWAASQDLDLRISTSSVFGLSGMVGLYLADLINRIGQLLF